MSSAAQCRRKYSRLKLATRLSSLEVMTRCRTAYPMTDTQVALGRSTSDAPLASFVFVGNATILLPACALEYTDRPDCSGSSRYGPGACFDDELCTCARRQLQAAATVTKKDTTHFGWIQALLYHLCAEMPMAQPRSVHISHTHLLVIQRSLMS